MKNLKASLTLVFSVALLYGVQAASAQSRELRPNTPTDPFFDERFNNPFDEPLRGSSFTPEETAVMAFCDESVEGYDPALCDEAIEDACESGVIDCNPVAEEDPQNPTDECNWDGCSEDLEGQ